MKKVKIVFGLVVLGLIALFVYQNLDFLLQRYDIGINFGFVDYHMKQQPMAIYLLAFFIAGLLTAFFLGLAGKFRSRKAIQNLTGEIETKKKRVEELEAKLASAASGPSWIGSPADLSDTDHTPASR